MNRRILLQVAGPTVLIGLLLFGVCLFGAWQVNRLQRDVTEILASNVASMQAAQQLETNVRQLRFHSFLYAIEPQVSLLHKIEMDQEAVEAWIEKADSVAHTPEEQVALADIRNGYAEFRAKMDRLRVQVDLGGPWLELIARDGDHPIKHIIDPCREFARINEEMMNQSAEESARVTRWLQGAMLLLGIGGPLSGLLSGFGIARGLSRSLYRLSVSVQDMAQHLEKDVASVRLTPEGDLADLESQLQLVVNRVAAVTRQLRAREQEMLRAQQLSAVGQLAASVAHEVRNPLTSIKMLVEASLRETKPRSFTPENLRVVHCEILKIEHHVQDFLDFARPPALKKQTCDLLEIVQRSVGLVGARARQQQVQIEYHAPEYPVLALVDPNQLSTVLVNLCINALDAMPKGGKLELMVDACKASGAEAGSTDEPIQIQVRDTGPGISKDMLDQLFTPFVSTKPTGSGLGLSISQRIIEEHGGSLQAVNESDGGACFMIWLPRVHGTAKLLEPYAYPGAK